MTRIRTMALAFGTALIVAACGGGPGSLDTEPVEELIDDVLDDVLSDDDFSTLDDCPIDDADDIVDDILSETDSDIVDDLLRTEFTATAYETEAGDLLDCTYGELDDTDFAGLYLTEAPRDLERFHEDLASGGDDDFDVDLDIDDGDEFRGGQFFEVCAEVDREEAYCELNWLDERVLVSIYVISQDAGSVDLDDALPAFEAALPGIIEQLAEVDPDDVELRDIGS